MATTAKQFITCAMCGHTYDPQENAACPTCPLNKGCSLTCCPKCGYESVDPSRSRLAGLFSSLFKINKTSGEAPRSEA
jgi:hypothetical protein